MTIAGATLRVGTAAEWAETNERIPRNDVCFESDTGTFKVGDGASTFADLAAASVGGGGGGGEQGILFGEANTGEELTITVTDGNLELAGDESFIYIHAENGGVEIDGNGDDGIALVANGAGGIVLTAGDTGIRIGNSGDKVGFGLTPIEIPTITGSRGGNAALASLLTQLQNLGLIVNSTS